ncbi:unnamed protein product [Paramecium sonneborni]|uniref:Uncharacterized protein n=1 Tax=Paramecium sonneborni TaxID=65129 RepID=A0A8S1RL43_9CILI|nr:unnamed protein product [Paramecium sonneborni]
MGIKIWITLRVLVATERNSIKKFRKYKFKMGQIKYDFLGFWGVIQIGSRESIYYLKTL